jgi:hypothetical protein
LETYCEVKAKDSDALGLKRSITYIALSTFVNYCSCKFTEYTSRIVFSFPRGLKKSDVTLQFDLASNFLNKTKYMYAERRNICRLLIYKTLIVVYFVLFVYLYLYLIIKS